MEPGSLIIETSGTKLLYEKVWSLVTLGESNSSVSINIKHNLLAT